MDQSLDWKVKSFTGHRFKLIALHGPMLHSLILKTIFWFLMLLMTQAKNTSED